MDDEPSIRTNVAIVLRRIDPEIEVAEASDGYMAIDIMEGTHYDVVITDIKMPGMDGITLIRSICERWADVQIVLLTGYPDFDYTREALRCGATDYLLKPVRFNTLQEMMERVRNRYRQMRIPQNVPQTPEGMEAIMASAQDYIRQHYNEKLTLDDMGQRFHLNSSYFSEQFNKVNGCSFVECLTEERMKQAKQLLIRRPGKSITDIAMEVGYGDSRYFSYVFRKAFGETPSDFRKNHTVMTE